MFHEFHLCLGGTLSLKINDNYSCGVKIQVAPNQETLLYLDKIHNHNPTIGFNEQFQESLCLMFSQWFPVDVPLKSSWL